MPARLIAVLLAAATLAGCSTVITGISQTIRVNSDPTRAECVLTRDAQVIAEVMTPGRVEVDKDKRDIQMVCSAEGYDDKVVTLRSRLSPATFANVISTAGIGFTVDALTGADNSYPEVVTVILRKPVVKPAPPAPPPPVEG